MQSNVDHLLMVDQYRAMILQLARVCPLEELGAIRDRLVLTAKELVDLELSRRMTELGPSIYLRTREDK